jgi:hypothetical protein
VIRAPRHDQRPLRRIVVANGEDLVIEITEGMVRMRAPKSRKTLVELGWGQLLTRAILARPVTRRREAV